MQVHHIEKLDAQKPKSLQIMKDSQGAFPDSINWSNVVDYMVPSSFHRLAAACSSANTVHYMHSTMWVLDIKGACPTHYSRSMNPIPLQSTWQQDKKLNQLRDFYGQGVELFSKQLEQQKATKIVRKKLLGNGQSMAWFYLAVEHYPTWVKAWQKEAQKVGLEAEVEVTHPPECSPLARTNSHIFLTVRYKRV
jgi:hypothetical protein